LFEITPDEQRRLMGMSAGMLKTSEVRSLQPGAMSQNHLQLPLRKDGFAYEQ